MSGINFFWGQGSINEAPVQRPGTRLCCFNQKLCYLLFFFLFSEKCSCISSKCHYHLISTDFNTSSETPKLPMVYHPIFKYPSPASQNPNSPLALSDPLLILLFENQWTIPPTDPQHRDANQADLIRAHVTKTCLPAVWSLASQKKGII